MAYCCWYDFGNFKFKQERLLNGNISFFFVRIRVLFFKNISPKHSADKFETKSRFYSLYERHGEIMVSRAHVFWINRSGFKSWPGLLRVFRKTQPRSQGKSLGTRLRKTAVLSQCLSPPRCKSEYWQSSLLLVKLIKIENRGIFSSYRDLFLNS